MIPVPVPTRGVACLLAAILAASALSGPAGRAQAPDSPEPAAPRPRILPPPPPTPEDIAAWERLWNPSGAPKPPEPVPSSAPLATATTPDRPVVRTRFDDVYASYATGDHGVVAREFRSAADFERFRPDLVSTLERWKSEPSPGHAAFALDIALMAFGQRWPNAGRFLAAARDIATARPEPFGARPEDDRFERLFHRAAVAVLAALNAPRDMEAYLDSIDARVATTAKGVSAGRPVDARLLLARATAREMATMPILLAAAARNDKARRTWIAGSGDDEARRRLSGVLEALELAVAQPEARAEALVRRGFVQHRLGNHTAALATLEDVEPGSDQVLAVWRALIRGRVLTALERHADALAAYEQAAALAAGAQTPAAALAALHLRMGHREEAVRWAADARATNANNPDPWPAYWMGDSRFLRDWLDEIRRFAS
jgi:tetratricopeptide (TPR) repeat protein